jgi:DNA polymerase-3 subunit delta'
VIWFAEFLDTEGNRLLKLIEEPPEGMYIYLVTEDRSRILNTIQSRCQSLVIKPLLDDEMAAYLRKHKGVEEEMAAKMAFIADGDMNQALKLLDAGNDDLFLEFILWMRVCYKLAPKELMDKVSQYQNWTKQQLKNFLEVGLNALEQILLAGKLNQTQLRLSEEAQKPILNLAKLLELDQIFEIKELIEQSIRSVERNANRKILIARQSLMIHRVIHRAPELESRKLLF